MTAQFLLSSTPTMPTTMPTIIPTMYAAVPRIQYSALQSALRGLDGCVRGLFALVDPSYLRRKLVHLMYPHWCADEQVSLDLFIPIMSVWTYALLLCLRCRQHMPKHGDHFPLQPACVPTRLGASFMTVLTVWLCRVALYYAMYARLALQPSPTQCMPQTRPTAAVPWVIVASATGYWFTYLVAVEACGLWIWLMRRMVALSSSRMVRILARIAINAAHLERIRLSVTSGVFLSRWLVHFLNDALPIRQKGWSSDQAWRAVQVGALQVLVLESVMSLSSRLILRV